MSTLTEFLTGIADAIRTKKGTTATIPAQNFATEITNLPSGGGSSSPETLSASASFEVWTLMGGSGSATVQVTIPQNDDNYKYEVQSVTVDTYYAGVSSYRYNPLSGKVTVNITSMRDDAGTVTVVWKRINVVANIVSRTITRVTAEDLKGATTIGGYALSSCSSLTSVEIPNSVTSIGGYAFYNCTALPSIEIPDSVTSIGQSAFYLCSSLTSIEIPDGVTSIGGSAFYNCRKLAVVDFRSATAVPTLGSGAFALTLATLKIVVPDSLYDSWIAATNWANYKSKIVKASEYTG